MGIKKDFKFDWIVKKQNILKEKKLKEINDFKAYQ